LRTASRRTSSSRSWPRRRRHCSNWTPPTPEPHPPDGRGAADPNAAPRLRFRNRKRRSGLSVAGSRMGVVLEWERKLS
jgi:hypothetical protein